MADSSRYQEINNGFRYAGGLLLGLAWMIVTGIGVTATLSGEPTGWLFLSISVFVFLITMDRWIKILPGLLAYGVLGGLLTIANGHALNRPDVQVSLTEGLIVTLCAAGSAAIAYTFTKRKLRLLDRIALLAFAAIFFQQMLVGRINSLAFGAALLCLVLAWGIDRYSDRHRPHKIVGLI